MDICNLVGGVGVHNLCVGYIMYATRPFLGGGEKAKAPITKPVETAHIKRELEEGDRST